MFATIYLGTLIEKANVD